MFFSVFNKISLGMGTLILLLGVWECKRTIVPFSPSPVEAPIAPNTLNSAVPDPPPVLPPPPDPSFVCAKGGFDGKRFYLLKEGGDTDYNIYKYTPKTKAELIALLDKKTPLDSINTYHITNMDSLFYNRNGYNFKGIENWMTCQVTTMRDMFAGTSRWKKSNFNGDISAWNVSQVRDMKGMFKYCHTFNQDLSEWDVGQVTNMDSMFFFCTLFNNGKEKKDLNSWQVGKVTTMRHMFTGSYSNDNMKFNVDISGWDVSQVKDMSGMFKYCAAFNQDISKWKVDNVTNMKELFFGCSALNQDLNNWNVAKVTNMSYMFYFCAAFNQDIKKWKVEKVTDMSYMFYRAASFYQNLYVWKVSSVIKCRDVFKDSKMERYTYMHPANFTCNKSRRK